MATNSPIVLGIDPGSRITGYGVITQRGSQLIHLASGSLSPPSQKHLSKRLDYFYEKLSQVIQNTRPQYMAVESIFYSKNIRSAISLAHARGIALLVGARAGLEVFEYSPMEVKSATVGYGKASKEQVAAMVVRLFGFSKNLDLSPDQSDALAVAICHLNTFSTHRHMFSNQVLGFAKGP